MRMLLVGVLSVALIGCSCPTAPQAMLEACTSKPCFYTTAASPPTELKPTPFKANPTTTKVGSKNATKTAKALSVAAKATKPTSPQTSNGSDKYKIDSPITMTQDSSAPPPQAVENAKSTVGMNLSIATSRQASEASDPAMAQESSAPPPQAVENTKSTVGTNVIDAVPRQASEASDPVPEKAKATVASKMKDPASVEFEDMTRAIRRDPIGQSIDIMAMVTTMLIGMRLLYGAWPWESGKTWYRTKPIVPAPTLPEPNSEATETPADTENDHFDRKLMAAE